MRPAVVTVATDVARAFPVPGPVLEIGARPADDEADLLDLRAYYRGRPFVGCDIQPGAGVDCVGDAHRLPFPDNSFGTALAFETLEHVADPHRVVQELYRVLRPGGMLAMTSVMFFPIHAHPWDYWRFTPEAFQLLLDPFETRLVVAHGWELLPEGVFGIGVKGPCPELALDRLPATRDMVSRWGDGLAVDFGPIRLTVKQLWRRTLAETGRALRARADRTLSKTRR